MIEKLRILALGALIIGFVLLSGCVQEKAPTKPTETVTQTLTVTQTAPPPTTAPPKPTTVLIEDTDPSFIWSNKCEIQKNPGASGGSWLACPKAGQPPAPGERINVTFTGTAVSAIYVTGPFGGIVKVQIDGNTYPDIDMYSKDVATKVKAEIASSLPNANHILTFEIANKKNPLSGQPNEAGVIGIDAIEITTLQ